MLNEIKADLRKMENRAREIRADMLDLYGEDSGERSHNETLLGQAVEALSEVRRNVEQHKDREQEYGCPNCGATDGQVQQDVVPAAAHILEFERDEDGELVPVWAGSTDVFWDGQVPAEGVPLYRCRPCGNEYDEPAIA